MTERPNRNRQMAFQSLPQCPPFALCVIVRVRASVAVDVPEIGGLIARMPLDRPEREALRMVDTISGFAMIEPGLEGTRGRRY